MENELKRKRWINSTGGPLILIDEVILPKWKGSSGTESNNLGFETDYESACEVNDYIGSIYVDNSKVLVFGDEPMTSTWFQISKSEGFIVRIEYANSEDEVETFLRKIPPNQEWQNTGVEIIFQTGNLVLMDSSNSYEQLEEKLLIKTEPGKYNIQTQFYKPTEDISLLLHRLNNLANSS